MPGLGQLAKCVRRIPHVAHRDRRGLHRPALQQLDHLPEDLLDPLRSRLDRIERSILDPRMRRRHRLGVSHVGLAHLQEPSARPLQPERCVHVLARQAVEHHIQPRPRSELPLEP
jgi:hypothetical protein